MSIEALHQWKNLRTQDVSSSGPANEQKTRSVNFQQEKKLPKFQLLLDHMAQTNNETQDKLKALSIKVDQCIQASERVTNTDPCSPAKDVTEVKATIAAIRANVDNFKATVKKENHDRSGSNKKINFGMLRLLETLTSVSTNQFRQMNTGKKTKKVHLQLQENPPEALHQWKNLPVQDVSSSVPVNEHKTKSVNSQHEAELPKIQHLWNYMVQTTNNTQDKLESLSKKVDLFIQDSELWKESKTKSVNFPQEKNLPEFHRSLDHMAQTTNDTQNKIESLSKKVDHFITATELWKESKTKSVNFQQEEKLPEFHRLWDHMAETTNDTQNKIESLSKKVDDFITASKQWKESETKSVNFKREEKLPEFHQLWNDMAHSLNATQDKFRALTNKVDHCVKEKHDHAGSNTKINFGMLRLLETLILVSTNQFRQMYQKKTKKVHLQLEEKTPENYRLWNHLVQTTNNTQDQLESLSKKVDDFIRASAHWKVSKSESVNSQEEEKLPDFQRLLDHMANTANDTQDKFKALTIKVDHCIQASERIKSTVQRMKDPEPLRYKMVS